MARRPIDWEQAYDSWGAVDRAYSPRRLVDVLRRWRPERPAPRVLELGCAPGRWLRWSERELGAEAHGVDLSHEGLRLTRSASPSVGAVRASADRLPYADGAFDLVISLGLLEHFEDPGPILRESYRVTRRGGLTIATTPNIARGTFQGWHWRTFDPANFEGHRTFTLEQLAGEVRGAGFEVLHAEHNGLYVPRMQRAIVRLGLAGVVRRLERARLATSLVVVGRRG